MALLLEDWHYAHQRLADAQARMTAVLDEFGLTELVISITGISRIGAASILARTGMPRSLAPAVLDAPRLARSGRDGRVAQLPNLQR